MDQYNRRSCAVVLVVKVDVAGVFLTGGNVWHGDSPCCVCVGLDAILDASSVFRAQKLRAISHNAQRDHAPFFARASSISSAILAIARRVSRTITAHPTTSPETPTDPTTNPTKAAA